MRITSFGAALLIYSTAIQAGGSIGLTNIEATLNQRPEFYEWLRTNLDIAPNGVAPVTIGRAINPKLALQRIGPYLFQAKPKGDSGPYTLLLTINMNTHFYDRRGKEVDPAKAVSIKETFANIEIDNAKP